MVWGDHTRVIPGAMIVLLAVASLTACGTEPESESVPKSTTGESLTLAQTKSPVQLLRNEAAGRIDEFVVEAVDATEDVSLPCQTVETDPLGLSRSWTSSVEMSIKAGSAWRASIVADELASSFEAQGWVASRGLPSAVSYIVLRSETSDATIGITLTTEGVAPARSAKLRITTNGPCVQTAGADSGEVMSLEGSE
jgi:hypothetical protein